MSDLILRSPCEHGRMEDHCDHWPDGDRSHSEFGQCHTASWCETGGGTDTVLDPDKVLTFENEYDPYGGFLEATVADILAALEGET